ncbi:MULTISPECIES: hypothetical protein [Acetobacter]|nr:MULTISPECIES: hypothetical protein [Acetobacter]MCP1278398.1 hypothetical protein [Acetobacter cerevisiae]
MHGISNLYPAVEGAMVSRGRILASCFSRFFFMGGTPSYAEAEYDKANT